MFKNKMINVLFIIISIKLFFSSPIYSATDIAGYINEYLKKNNLKSYNIIIDPDHIIEDIRIKMINKYHELLKKKYDFNTLVVISRQLKEYQNSSFVDELCKEIYSPKKLQKIKSLIILITVDDNKIKISATEKMKHIFSETVLNNLIEKINSNIKKDDWFSNIFDLLKEIDIFHQKYNFNIHDTDL